MTIKWSDLLDMVVKLKLQYCKEKFQNLLIPMRHFYNVQF